MTNKESIYAKLGFEYAEGIEQVSKISLPWNGRYIYKTDEGWQAQPHNDNYWREFVKLEDAIKFSKGIK